MGLIYEVENTGVNANTTTLGTALALNEAKHVGIYIKANTGSNTTHVVTLQVSADDGTTWYDTNHTITGIGNIHDALCIATHVRFKVTTLQGATSTVDITIIAK